MQFKTFESKNSWGSRHMNPSTIAQQLGLEVSTVANFFMNARRRSLDKWQEDTSKASSTANSPSDSPYSRSGQGQQSSNNNNLCYAKDEDAGNCTAYSPPSRPQLGHSLPTSAPVPTNKTSDISFISGNRIDLERITHNNSLAVCSSFTKPSINLIRTSTNNNNGLFTALQRRNNPGSNLNHSGNHTFNALNNADSHSAVPNALYTSHQQEQQTGTQDLPNNYPVHLPPQIQHPPQLHNHHHIQGLSHPLNRQTATAAPSQSASSHQLTYPMDTLDRNENCTQIHSNGNINLDNHIRESVYSYNNSHINYVFPVTGSLHSHHPSHINLLHPNTNTNNSISNVSNTNSNPNVNIPNMNGTNTLRNHFLMHDLTGSSQFDHRFLSTMTSGHRALTEQALELCSSLAAANAISLNNTTSNINCTNVMDNNNNNECDDANFEGSDINDEDEEDEEDGEFDEEDEEYQDDDSDVDEVNRQGNECVKHSLNSDSDD
ncbi:unnamed protein product [Trichobilharzia regenti]|nr:unnamed protein product [Trichobilharzia regenti]